MKKVSAILLAATLALFGLATILGTGGTTDSDGPDRQWVSYQGSSSDCKNWCQQRIDDNGCSNGSFSHDAGLCTCDGENCSN